jgi:hypothetical protein
MVLREETLMAARRLTFKQYVADGEGRPPVQFWWRGLLGRPVDLDSGELLAGAGLTGVPLEELASGYLEAPWQGHPRHALIITRSIYFRPGDRYAVSLEPAPTPP